MLWNNFNTLYVLEWNGKKYFFKYEDDRNLAVNSIRENRNTIKKYEIPLDLVKW